MGVFGGIAEQNLQQQQQACTLLATKFNALNGIHLPQGIFLFINFIPLLVCYGTSSALGSLSF